MHFKYKFDLNVQICRGKFLKNVQFWNWAMQLVLIAKASRGQQHKKTSRDV
jgi:hypothetical protein